MEATDDDTDDSDNSEPAPTRRNSNMEADYDNKEWVRDYDYDVEHHLDTRDPPWEKVFPCIGPNFCQFCEQSRCMVVLPTCGLSTPRIVQHGWSTVRIVHCTDCPPIFK